MADKTFTTAEVAKHKDAVGGFWIIIENDVYDVTSEYFSSSFQVRFPSPFPLPPTYKPTK
jgi:hypothetical protein